MASLTTYALAGAVIVVLGYISYRAALPKPIPGIPYIDLSATRLFGDIPDAVTWQNDRKEFWSFLYSRCKELNSPIVQVWMRPLQKPWVILADYRESQDIMMRRGKEFDRSGFLGDLFGAIAPNVHVSMLTNDKWRAHRRLMADTMSPAFLNEVAAPQIHATALITLQLWKQKTRLTQGHPFSATEDVFKSAMDALWAATFGSEISTTKNQLQLLSSLDKVDLPSDRDEGVHLPEVKDPEAFTALLALADSVEWAVKSPVPKLTHKAVVSTFPHLRKATRDKNRLLEEKLEAAKVKFSKSGGKPADIKHALDLVVQREIAMAKKEGREAQTETKVIQDELFGFLLAGNDTTSTTILWGLKYLQDHQEAQQKLRAALRATHTRAAEAEEVPTVNEIIKASVPYLDATLEEILRCAGPAPGNSRRALVDAPVLGHVVPKGTDVLMLLNGASFVDNPLPYDDKKRSKSSLDAKDAHAMWDLSDISQFKPERWLVTDKGGKVSFDGKAGPFQSFGAGQRGCFGRKMAMLTLKIFFTLIVWTYKLEPTPERYRSYMGQDKATHQPQSCYIRLSEVQ